MPKMDNEYVVEFNLVEYQRLLSRIKHAVDAMDHDHPVSPQAAQELAEDALKLAMRAVVLNAAQELTGPDE